MYSPDGRSPLHPASLSEGAASLLPDQERQALLWTIDLDDAGYLADAHLERALVRSRAQLTYRQAAAGAELLMEHALDHLASLGLVRRLPEGVRPLPAIARYRVAETETPKAS